MIRYIIPGLLLVLATIGVAGCGQAEPTPLPTATPAAMPTPDPRIDQILERMDRLGEGWRS